MRKFTDRLVLISVSAWLALATIACNSTTSSNAAPTELPTPETGLQVLLANSIHVVGANRFPIGIVREGRSVKDAQASRPSLSV